MTTCKCYGSLIMVHNTNSIHTFFFFKLYTQCIFKEHPKMKANILNRPFSLVFTNDNVAASRNLGPNPLPSMSNIFFKINSDKIASQEPKPIQDYSF